MKKLLSLLLASALTLLLAAPALAADYTDVSESDWFYEAVDWCAEKGLMSGTGEGRFSPDAEITRGMAVTVLYRMAGEPEVSGRVNYSDVTPGAWYEKAVNWAVRTGIASGYDYGAFGVDDPMTREMLATMLWRYAGAPLTAAGEDFADEAAISNWAADAVDWARSGKVLSGKPGNLFDPQGTATRAQLAQVLMNFVESGFNRISPAMVSHVDVMGAPAALAVTEGGLLLMTDTFNKVVWQVKESVSSLYAGTVTVPDEAGIPLGGYKDAALDEALFASPWGIAPFLDGWAISDPDNNVLRLVRLTGVETVNADTKENLPKGEMGVMFQHPTGLTADKDGNLYVADTFAGAVRKIDEKGMLTTVAEGLEEPMGLAWADGVLYIAETGANRVMKLTDGTLSVLAGSGEADHLDGAAATAAFSSPMAVAVGPDGTVYVSDTANGAVRSVKNGVVATVIQQEDADPESLPVSPVGLLVRGGNLYICDNFSRKLISVPLG